MYRNFFKRGIDFSLSLLALLFLSPLLIVVTIWLHYANKGAGAFFTQERPGRDEKIFKIVKFKSMTDERDADGNLLPDAQRLTKVGRFVRSTSIDELPQLFNVLKGDMSLIGPRPLLVRYLPYYTQREAMRHSVRPGMTGWAQINGRNNLKWDDRLELDVWYVEHLSFLLDLKVVFRTIKNVLSRTDVNVVVTGEFMDVERSRKPVVLRCLRKDDLPTRVQWMNDVRTYATLNIKVPITLERTELWYSNVSANSLRRDFVFEKGDLLVAMGGLTQIDEAEKEAECYIFVNPNMQRCGIGTDSVRLICTYAFDELKLQSLYIWTDEDNLSARKMYEKLGFELVKILQQERIVNGDLRNRCFYKKLLKY